MNAGIDDDVESQDRQQYGVIRWLLRLLQVGPALILGLLIVFLWTQSGVFMTTRNWGNILAQSAVLAVLAMAQLLVILTRGIDLSVGSVLALTTVVGALAFEHVSSGPFVIVVIVSTGLLVGLVNGVVYVKGRLPHPFIITLAMLSIARGLALQLSNGRPKPGMPDLIQAIGSDKVAWIPVSTFVVAALVLVMVFLTKSLVWGRWIYSVGGDPDAARRSGIPVDRVLISVYAISGIAAGVAGVLTAGRTNGGSPNFGNLAELDAIAAVIIGGASFLGGRGHVGHALVGAFMISVTRNGLNLLGVSAFFEFMAIGLIIVIAVEGDVVRSRLEERFRALSVAP